ncbi:MAG: hypothetical protein QHC67_10120 [Sphingobium sp.]|nr:hypothetical protein [Sphingobium sp.]MDX3910161.1 hypothetical protein [Sphingobium sp.]
MSAPSRTSIARPNAAIAAIGAVLANGRSSSGSPVNASTIAQPAAMRTHTPSVNGVSRP